jgi:hypothetical protein
MTYRVRPLDDTTWPAFAALVERNNGIFGGCWCMGFHPEGLSRDSAELNRDRKLARVRAGEAHAALVFDDDGACLGWCQFGPPAELPRDRVIALHARRLAFDHPFRHQARVELEAPVPDYWNVGSGTADSAPA